MDGLIRNHNVALNDFDSLMLNKRCSVNNEQKYLQDENSITYISCTDTSR